MKFKYIILLLIVLPALLYSQKIGQWRMTEDFTVGERIGSYPDAYALHTVANIYFIYKLEDFGLTWWQADLATFTLGVLWEVKDGYIPQEEVPIFGGDGFSTTDIAVNGAIIVVHRLAKFTIKKIYNRLDRPAYFFR